MATEPKIIKEEIGINSEFGPIKEPVNHSDEGDEVFVLVS